MISLLLLAAAIPSAFAKDGDWNKTCNWVQADSPGGDPEVLVGTIYPVSVCLPANTESQTSWLSTSYMFDSTVVGGNNGSSMFVCNSDNTVTLKQWTSMDCSGTPDAMAYETSSFQCGKEDCYILYTKTEKGDNCAEDGSTEELIFTWPNDCLGWDQPNCEGDKLYDSSYGLFGGVECDGLVRDQEILTDKKCSATDLDVYEIVDCKDPWGPPDASSQVYSMLAVVVAAVCSSLL